MVKFAIDADGLAESSERAGKRAAQGEGPALLTRMRAGEELDDGSMATLLLSREVPTDDLFEIARSRRPAGPPQIETFSPLYFTNECDGECLMCGMRNGSSTRT